MLVRNISGEIYKWRVGKAGDNENDVAGKGDPTKRGNIIGAQESAKCKENGV